MGYANAVLLGDTRAFCKAYYIAAGNGGGLKCVISMLILRTDYIAAGNGGGLKQLTQGISGPGYYIAAGNSGGLKKPIESIFGILPPVWAGD